MKTEDMQKIRDKERLLLSIFLNSLETKGLETELIGSATKGDMQYNDIDILAIGPKENLDYVYDFLKDAGERGALSVEELRCTDPYGVAQVLDYHLKIKKGILNVDLCMLEKGKDKTSF